MFKNKQLDLQIFNIFASKPSLKNSLNLKIPILLVLEISFDHCSNLSNYLQKTITTSEIKKANLENVTTYLPEMREKKI